MKLLVFIFSIGLFSCNGQSINKNLSAIELFHFGKPYTKNANKEDKYFIVRYFMISGSKRETEARLFAKKCAENIKDSTSKEYDNVDLVFFKESDITNLKQLKRTPEDIDQNIKNNAQVYAFTWKKGDTKISETRYNDRETFKEKTTMNVGKDSTNP